MFDKYFCVIAALALLLGASLTSCSPTYTYNKADELPLEKVCDERANPRGELLMDAKCGVELTRMTAESACEAGNGEGCAMASFLTLTDKSVDDAVDMSQLTGDYERARALARRGCTRDNEASCLLESIALFQSPVAEDHQLALKLMDRRCQQGMGEICFMLGSMFEENGKTGHERQQSVAYYRESCTNENASGCFKYAELLDKGFGVAENDERARTFFNRACDMNHVEACAKVDREVGEDREEMLNEFVRVSKKSFIEMMQTGCENGFRHGCTFAGRLVDRGEIRTRYIGHETAVELFSAGCERGAAASCYYLARKVKNGRGAEANTATAAQLAAKACKLGHQKACTRQRDYTFRLFKQKDAEAHAEKCEQGDAESCYLAGRAFAYDVNFDADYERAVELLVDGCELDYADACESAGALLVDEQDQPHDPDRAIGLLDKGCENGADHACFALGMAYEQGNGVERDFEKSELYLRLACEREVGVACGELGSYYEVGESVKQDLGQAEKLYSRGCASGNVDSCTNLAALLQVHQDSAESFGRALDLYQLSCANDEPRACAQLGNMLTSVDDKKLEAEGMDYLERSCMLEYGPGCRFFGLRYYHGKGTDEDPRRAMMLWQQACDLDDPTGCLYLGELYRDGEGVDKDGARALEIFEKSCEQGNADGCIRAAGMFLTHEQTDYQPMRGLQLYEKACQDGSDAACVGAADLLTEGIHVEQSFEKAVGYLETGCKADGMDSCDHLGEYLRLGIGVTKDVERANEHAQTMIDDAKEACRKNEDESCAYAAHLIAHSRGTDTNLDKARSYLQAQCTHDVEAGCREMAEQKATGELFERNREEAIASLESLCEDGMETACEQTAFFLRFGRSDEIDLKRAVDLWEPLCEADETSLSCIRLGNAYIHGLGVDADEKRGLKLLSKTCTAADRDGCLNYTIAQVQERPDAVSKAVFERSKRECDRKNPAACVREANFLAHGVFGDRDLSGAADAFERACESGSVDACPLAEALRDNASRLSGDATSAVAAGLAAEFGVGQQASADDAAAHYEKACAQDDRLGCQLRVSLASFNKAPLLGDAHYEHTRKACELGSASYCYDQGRRFASFHWDVGVEMIRRACRGDVQQACIWLNSNGEKG